MRLIIHITVILLVGPLDLSAGSVCSTRIVNILNHQPDSMRPEVFDALMQPRRNVFEIPVVGDSHGNLEGVFSVVQKVQQRNGRKFPFVLRVGDNGYWPDESDIEPRPRHGLDWETAAGFHRHLRTAEFDGPYRREARGLNRVDATFLDTWGNHDDGRALKVALDSSEGNPVALDREGRILLLPEGNVLKLQDSETSISIRIAALGGIESHSRRRATQDVIFRDRSIEDLRGLSPDDVDVFVTHQGTTSALKGSQTVEDLVRLIKPRIHLHGHSHQSTEFEVGPTRSIGLGRLPGERRANPKPDFMGFLVCDTHGNLDFQCSLTPTLPR